MMLLLHGFFHEVMSISGVALKARTWTVQFYWFTVNVLRRKLKKTWMKYGSMDNSVMEWRWWRRVGLTERQEDCQCQQIIQIFSFKKQGGALRILLRLCGWDRFVRSFSWVILRLFLKEGVKREKFHCLPFFPLILGLQSKKTSYFYGTGYILYPYF
jgi:hypothetical protein